MFWDQEEDPQPTSVWTAADRAAYTHIIYLCVDPETVARRRRNDSKRVRALATEGHLARWADAESTNLRQLCLECGILFCPLYESDETLARAEVLLSDFRQHSEERNLQSAKARLYSELNGTTTPGNRGRWQRALVFDADRTLAAEDAGALSWSAGARDQMNPLKAIFSSDLGYSYTAFRQAMLLYESKASHLLEANTDTWCDQTAYGVSLYPELVSLLTRASNEPHIVVVVLTCGPRRVWSRILQRISGGGRVVLIGGGCIADGFVVTPEVKAALVRELKDKYQLDVWAFGDSPVDLPMMRAADEAVVVVGSEATRSKTMEAALDDETLSLSSGGKQLRQALIPATVRPRLDTWRLPVVNPGRCSDHRNYTRP